MRATPTLSCTNILVPGGGTSYTAKAYGVTGHYNPFITLDGTVTDYGHGLYVYGLEADSNI